MSRSPLRPDSSQAPRRSPGGCGPAARKTSAGLRATENVDAVIVVDKEVGRAAIKALDVAEHTVRWGRQVAALLVVNDVGGIRVAAAAVPVRAVAQPESIGPGTERAEQIDVGLHGRPVGHECHRRSGGRNVRPELVGLAVPQAAQRELENERRAYCQHHRRAVTLKLTTEPTWQPD